MVGLRMRQKDDTDKVEEASYESHCVYAVVIARELSSGRVGTVNTAVVP